MSVNQKTGGFHYGFLIAIALCAIMGTAVALTYSAAGVFYTPVSKALGVGKGVFAIYISVLCLAAALTLTFAGKIITRYSARVILSIAVAVVALSFAAMSTFTSVFQFYVAGAFLGIAQAFLLYLSVPTLINRWFKERIGFFMGLCSAFTGVGGIIFNPMAGYIISTYGWRTGYLAYAIITAVIGLPFAVFVLRDYPSDKGLKPYGDTGEIVQNVASAPLTGVSYSIAVKSSVFYIALLFSFAVAFVTNINFYLPSYASSLGLTLTIGATIASASMFGNMLGKILLGYVNDKSVVGGMAVCFGAGILGMGLLIFLGTVGVWVVLLGGFLYGISYAGVSVQTPMVIKKVFGNRDYGPIYSNIAIAAAVSSTIGSSAWGFIIDGTGGYVATLGIASAILALAFILGYAAINIGKKFVHTAK